MEHKCYYGSSGDSDKAKDIMYSYCELTGWLQLKSLKKPLFDLEVLLFKDIACNWVPR